MPRMDEVRALLAPLEEEDISLDEIADDPAIDEVACVLDHVREFDGGFRTFMTSFVHRNWVLRRRDGGPWRITEVQSL